MRFLAVLERRFVREEDALVGDRDDVVVKGAALDRHVRLAKKQRARGIEPVPSRDRLRCVEVLARGKRPPPMP